MFPALKNRSAFHLSTCWDCCFCVDRRCFELSTAVAVRGLVQSVPTTLQLSQETFEVRRCKLHSVTEQPAILRVEQLIFKNICLPFVIDQNFLFCVGKLNTIKKSLLPLIYITTGYCCSLHFKGPLTVMVEK